MWQCCRTMFISWQPHNLYIGRQKVRILNSERNYQSGPHIGFCIDLAPSDQMNQGEDLLQLDSFRIRYLHSKFFCGLLLSHVRRKLPFAYMYLCITRFPFPSTRYHFWAIVHMTYISKNIFLFLKTQYQFSKKQVSFTFVKKITTVQSQFSDILVFAKTVTKSHNVPKSNGFCSKLKNIL